MKHYEVLHVTDNHESDAVLCESYEQAMRAVFKAADRAGGFSPSIFQTFNARRETFRMADGSKVIKRHISEKEYDQLTGRWPASAEPF